VLGRSEDIGALTTLHTKVKEAFMHRFFDENMDLIDASPTQTSYLLGLAYDLFPDNKRELAVAKLINLIKQADTHLRTGFLGTPLLTAVLQDAGRSDLVYELLFNETYPSWFYSINNGATTTWERWDSYSIEEGFNPQGMNSLNHYAYGTVSRWFYEGILGIKPAEPGFERIDIHPQFSDRLNQASGGYKTPHGEVTVNWEIDAKVLSMQVTVPKNTTANIKLPLKDTSLLKVNGSIKTEQALSALSPGTYQIEAEIVY
jgi:alpha-L-rhamnosidase